jgi:hypothetical protein
LLQPKTASVPQESSSTSAGSSSSPTQSSQAGSIPSSHTSAHIQQTEDIDYHAEPTDLNAIIGLIAQPSFLQHVSTVYLRDISWYIDMLSDTRLQRFIDEPHDSTSSSTLWDEIYIHALAITALVAQTCPTDIQVTLLSMDSASRYGFMTGRAVSQAAYNVAISRIEEMVSSKQHPQTWPSEVFASAALLRVVEKNNDPAPSLSERYLVDISRMMKAKLHQHNINRAHAQHLFVSHRMWQEEHDLLAYRMFWHCYVDDM